LLLSEYGCRCLLEEDEPGDEGGERVTSAAAKPSRKAGGGGWSKSKDPTPWFSSTFSFLRGARYDGVADEVSRGVLSHATFAPFSFHPFFLPLHFSEIQLEKLD
jgi:hypothetical protein